MALDEQIEFYRSEYQAAKTKAMALVAFGAYMALCQLRSEASPALSQHQS
jgi:hypothetical protein